MKNSNVKTMIVNILSLVVIIAILIIVANLFIFLLPIVFFLAIIYYLYRLFFKDEIKKRRKTYVNKGIKENVQEAQVVKEKMDD